MEKNDEELKPLSNLGLEMIENDSKSKGGDKYESRFENEPSNINYLEKGLYIANDNSRLVFFKLSYAISETNLNTEEIGYNICNYNKFYHLVSSDHLLKELEAYLSFLKKNKKIGEVPLFFQSK